MRRLESRSRRRRGVPFGSARLLQEFVLLCRKRAWKSLREARKVLATDQMGEFRKLFHPCELIEDTTQSDQPVDTGCGRERWCLRPQPGHPTQDVGGTAQLVEARHLRIIGTEAA